MKVKDMIEKLQALDPNARVLLETMDYKAEEVTYETVEAVIALDMMEHSYNAHWDIFSEEQFNREYRDSDDTMKRFFTRRENCVVISGSPIFGQV